MDTKRFTLRYITGKLAHPMSFDTYAAAAKVFQRAVSISTEHCDHLLYDREEIVAVHSGRARRWQIVTKRDLSKDA